MAGWRLIVLGGALKALCFHLYHSTDLDVHHYWLVLAGHVSWREWYTDESSVWTLDYPPIFALFQWLLFLLYQAVEGVIESLPQRSLLRASLLPAFRELLAFPPAPLSRAAIDLLRCSVLLSDFVLLYSLYRYSNGSFPSSSALLEC